MSMSFNTMDRGFAERLVSEVQQHTVLYDASHPDYKDRGKVDMEWTKVSAVLGAPVDFVRKRWQNLRGSFSRSLASRNLPSGSGVKKSVRFYLEEQMAFLKCHMVHATTTSAATGYYNYNNYGSSSSSSSARQGMADDVKLSMSPLAAPSLNNCLSHSHSHFDYNNYNNSQLPHFTAGTTTDSEFLLPPSSGSSAAASTSSPDPGGGHNKHEAGEEEEEEAGGGRCSPIGEDFNYIAIQQVQGARPEDGEDGEDGVGDMNTYMNRTEENKKRKRRCSGSSGLPAVESAILRFLEENSERKAKMFKPTRPDNDISDNDLNFLKGLLPHIRDLNVRNKRSFFNQVTSTLFALLEKQETDSQSPQSQSQSGVT